MPQPFAIIPHQMKPIVDQFIWEAEKRGVNVDINVLSIEFEVGIGGSTAQNSIVGNCTLSDNRHLIKIDTTNSLWQFSSKLGREEIVFHELGHCLLDRAHRDDKFISDDFFSIMRTVGLLQYGNLNNFSSIFVDPSDLRAHRRDYYIEELFNQDTPNPCWSDPNAISPFPLTTFENTFIKERKYLRMWIDPSGNLWFFGREKNYLMTNGVFQEQLPNLNIEAMSNDNQGNLWIAGFEQGAVSIGTYFSGKYQPAYQSKDFPVLFSGIDQFLIDAANRFWVSDVEGNLYVQFEQGFEIIPGLANGRVTTMRKGPDGTVYLLKGARFYVFEDPQSYIEVNEQNSELPISFFRRLEVDGNGIVWLQPVGTPSGTRSYLLQFTPNFEVKRLEYQHINLSDIRINSLTVDTDGDLWAATTNGIKKWEGASFSNYCSYNTGVPMLHINQIAVGTNSNIWSVGLDLESNDPLLMLTEAGL